MFKLSTMALMVAFCLSTMVSSVTAQATAEKKNVVNAKPQAKASALNFKMKNIEGKEVSLAKKYKGKVVVFVNVASRCGFTRQYKGLQELHAKYGDKGLAVIGVPCNQFGGQEPGTEAEIAKFCDAKFGVEFDMMSKVDVKGDKQCDLYKHLTSLDLAPTGKGNVRWNFEKIVLDRSGKPIARFGSRDKPMGEKMVKVIEGALNKKS